MALTLHGETLTNPVNVVTDTVPVVADNVAYGGLVRYDHTLTDARMYVHTINIQWQKLTSDELEAIRTVWRAACEDYVFLIMDGLNIIGSGMVDSDELNVIAQNDTALEVTFDQAYTADGVGPILFDVAMDLVSRPQSGSL